MIDTRSANVISITPFTKCFRAPSHRMPNSNHPILEGRSYPPSSCRMTRTDAGKAKDCAATPAPETPLPPFKPPKCRNLREPRTGNRQHLVIKFEDPMSLISQTASVWVIKKHTHFFR